MENFESKALKGASAEAAREMQPFLDAVTTIWSHRAESRHLRHLLAQAADERQRYYDALREVRSSILEAAEDAVWMASGIETVVDFIAAAVDGGLRERAAATAAVLVAKWEHGNEEHRQWLRNIAIPDIIEALLTWRHLPTMDRPHTDEGN